MIIDITIDHIVHCETIDVIGKITIQMIKKSQSVMNVIRMNRYQNESKKN